MTLQKIYINFIIHSIFNSTGFLQLNKIFKIKLLMAFLQMSDRLSILLADILLKHSFIKKLSGMNYVVENLVAKKLASICTILIFIPWHSPTPGSCGGKSSYEFRRDLHFPWFQWKASGSNCESKWKARWRIW